MGEVKLSNEGLHDSQRFDKGPGVKLSDQTPSGYDIDVAKILLEIGKKVENPLDIDIQMPMEAWHIFTILGKPVNPVAAVDDFDK